MRARDTELQIFLVGHASEKILGRKLPTNEQVLSLFFYKYKIATYSIKKSFAETIDEVTSLWKHAEMPICRIDFCINKLKKMYGEWYKIYKNRFNKKSPAQIEKEREFTSKLKSIFDIVPRDAGEKLETENQRLFFASQFRSSHRGLITSVCHDDIECAKDPSDDDHGERTPDYGLNNIEGK